MAVGSAITLDPYAALEVVHDASSAAIRSSYKKLMLKCHPDKVRDEAQRAEKADQFQKVQEAYELLIDPRRRRKYDEELARKGSPGAGGGAAPAEEESGGAKRERRSRRRHDDETRRSREEASHGEAEKHARREHKAQKEAYDREREHLKRDRERDRDRDRASAAAAASEEAQPPPPPPSQPQPQPQKHASSSRHAYGTASRYANGEVPTPRKSSYAPPMPQKTSPHSPPPAPPSETDTETTKPATRPGYEERVAAEKAKLEAVRRRTREAQGVAPESPRTTRSNSHDHDELKAAMAAEQVRIQMAEQARRMEQDRLAREMERAQRKAAKEASEFSERPSRPTDIPSNRTRKLSRSPKERRPSASSVSNGGYTTTPPFGTAIKGPNGPFSGSVPTSNPFYGSPPHMPYQVRRSVSSPSLEQQTSRQQQAQSPQCDSGYSSPSPNDITTPTSSTSPPVTLENNVPNPSPTDGSASGWKKYTIYVKEGDTSDPPPPGSGSPGSSHHAEPLIHHTITSDQPLRDIFAKAANPNPANGSSVFWMQSPMSSHPYPASHSGGPSSSHSSPRVRHSTNSAHHYSSVPPLQDSFSMGSPSLARAGTYSGPSPQTKKTSYGFSPPPFVRGGTWGP